VLDAGFHTRQPDGANPARPVRDLSKHRRDTEESRTGEAVDYLD